VSRKHTRGTIDGRKALSLEERIAFFRTRGRKLTPGNSGYDTASDRAKQWMQQFPFGDAEIFKRRLAVFNHSQDEFLNALSNDQAIWEDVSGSIALDWTQTLKDIYASSEPTTRSTTDGMDNWRLRRRLSRAW
jgi:hypothetical protein